MPLVCTLSPTIVTQYGRGAIHLLRLNFALLSFVLIIGLFGLCNIINLSHADLGPPTTDDRSRAARKVTKFWLNTRYRTCHGHITLQPVCNLPPDDQPDERASECDCKGRNGDVVVQGVACAVKGR